jgi:xanthine dehydrogenase molybdenum-binding subunit
LAVTTSEYRVIGTRPVRPDGVDKVTGRAVYGGDVRLPGLLAGRILRSPRAHARIRRLDVSRAWSVPGVKAVVTGRDLPEAEDRVVDLGEETVNLKHLRDAVLATDKVFYQGHPVAAVAALTARDAEEALRLIEVEYEPLPPVLDVRQAMADGAPLLHESLTTEESGEPTDRQSNVAAHEHFELGDPEAGFREAHWVVEREVELSTVHQGYVEPHNATALWSADGGLTIWCSTQGAFDVRAQCADILGQPVSKIRVVPTEIGGGFGGKIRVYLEPVAALLSRQCGRPVQLTMTRAEVFQATGPAPGGRVRVKIGATREGRLTAAEAEIIFEAGAYPGGPIGAASQCVFAAYDIPNGRVDAYDVVVNKPRCAAYRAPGSPQVAFATEQVVDELAERVGMDPIEFRLLNSAREGTQRIDGPVHLRIGSVEVLEAARATPHYQSELPEPAATAIQPSLRRGRGMAHGFWFNAGLQSSCTISVSGDGRVQLMEGSTDIGGTRASIAMQAAEILGLDMDDVKPSVGDTDSVGFTSLTGGSRTTFATGLAAIEASRDVLRQMQARAALLWELDEEEVQFAEGVFTGPQGQRLTFKELAAKLEETGGPITGRANVKPEGRGGAFATCVVDVEVDLETGKVAILRCTVIQDVGRAIHPSYVEGQMQGGVAQGIGWALSEGYAWDDQGHLLNASFLDYRMPTALDLPMIDTVIVEVPNPGHPFGVRGVGEVPIVPPPAAVANALYRALGVRLGRLPIDPRTVLEATGQLG